MGIIMGISCREFVESQLSKREHGLPRNPVCTLDAERTTAAITTTLAPSPSPSAPFVTEQSATSARFVTHPDGCLCTSCFHLAATGNDGGRRF